MTNSNINDTSLENGLAEPVSKSTESKKKKKTKPAESKSSIPTETSDAAPSASGHSFSIQNLRDAVGLIANHLPTAPKNEDAAKVKAYQFWNTQPVPKFHEEIDTYGPIEPDKPISEVRAEPYSLPDGFSWDTLSLDDPKTLQEVYLLLNENYVEDGDNMFRFDYSPEFLLCEQRMVEINFLCVHKKLRSKRVAPVLIKEITRRVHQTGCFQAVYTAGVLLPKPLATCRYWHRSLNPKKLIEVGFSHLSRNMTMQRTIKLYRLPEQPRTVGFRPLEKEDVPATRKLLMTYLKKFDLVPTIDDEEFAHWFLPRVGVINSYIVKQDGAITDMVSYYTLPSTVMSHPTHKSIKAAYSFMNVATKTKWTDLMNDALIVAKNDGYDVFNALDLMDNKEFLEALKFGIGDGELHYYIYNWKCPTMPSEKVGLVLQ
ncbi:hypothetical protein QYM36_016337 [Artemia franciscana]|uniref:Glycylpeptide N-tetradecanoyltransferase n=1 Tax=Artemia franciscana TaxID=6661 RepID=A0AA88KTL7_ARTSF|nr:hypothetical protein QYM36_016337 [Artemia franciscana]